ncbi:MAG: hypothetical protein JNN15_07755 [Blastocatellia bacterium]|nr:hypothetical protein [Blastocatellia bacterium]
METAVLEKLFEKLMKLTQTGKLRWYFAGNASKAYVTVYKDARLKITAEALDITELGGQTLRVDPLLHGSSVVPLLSRLQKVAVESSSYFQKTKNQPASSPSLSRVCERLLEDEERLFSDTAERSLAVEGETLDG